MVMMPYHNAEESMKAAKEVSEKVSKKDFVPAVDISSAPVQESRAKVLEDDSLTTGG